MAYTLEGISGSPGIAIGDAFWLKKQVTVQEFSIENTHQEIHRLESVIAYTQEQIISLHQLAMTRMGKEEAAIFEAHLSFLEDPSFTGEMKKRIDTRKKNAESICEEVTTEMYRVFQSLDNEYMRARAEDIRDVGNRLLKNMTSQDRTAFPSLPPKAIVIAYDLTPSDTVQLSKEINGIVTAKGSRNSHAAIIARTLGIPAVFGLQGNIERIKNKDLICLDGDNGMINLNPTPADQESFLERLKRYTLHTKQTLHEATKDTYTANGKRIHVFANIGHLRDLEPALLNHAEGIGLFRTEFLYLEKEQWPTEEEQFEAYSQVVKKFSPRPVIIRTLDIGGDKQIPYANLPIEDNPYLGCRGIRYCLANVEIFKTQLYALLRASVYGDLWILLPMIDNADQVKELKKLLLECKRELHQKSIPYKDVNIGAMIEVPAAALMAESLAKEVDFFSIGTNDLTQYTLAADRGNGHVVHLYDENHPAVMLLIQMVCNAAQKEKIPVGICGELASNIQATEKLIRMGIQELSAAPSMIPRIKQTVRTIHLEKMNKTRFIDKILE